MQNSHTQHASSPSTETAMATARSGVAAASGSSSSGDEGGAGEEGGAEGGGGGEAPKHCANAWGQCSCRHACAPPVVLDMAPAEHFCNNVLLWQSAKKLARFGTSLQGI